MTLNQEQQATSEPETDQPVADAVDPVRRFLDDSDEQAVGIAQSVSLGIAAQLPWLGPLIEAAIHCPTGRRRPVEILTAWGGFPAESGIPAEANEPKHQAYAAYILEVLNVHYPWLLAIMNASRVTLLVYPGSCRYTVTSEPMMARALCSFEILDLVPLTHLTPFPPEEGDVVH